MGGSRTRGFVEASVPDAYERFMTGQLFEPWARELLLRARPGSGVSVLDVASGPGVVARLAAVAVGVHGRVVASDISPAMLQVAAAKPAEVGSAPIEYLECSAVALDLADESFELAFCQHGLQFFPDRAGALREMHRVLAPGGSAVVSTWAAERPLGLFGSMCDALREAEVAAPYPGAFDPDSYRLGVEELRAPMTGAGFGDVAVETVELDCVWSSVGDALGTISGTPYGPLIAALPAHEREAILESLAAKLGGRAEGEVVVVRTASNIARGTK